MTISARPYFAGFQADDRSYFQPSKPPEAPAGRQIPSDQPAQRGLSSGPARPRWTDTVLMDQIEAAVHRGDADRRWALEWVLKARIMQLNAWASGEAPYPHQHSWLRKVDAWKARRDARRLFHRIGGSPVYFPPGWILFHLGRLSQRYRLDPAPYFPVLPTRPNPD